MLFGAVEFYVTWIRKLICDLGTRPSIDLAKL